ncbi:MAG: hypothetical protein AB7F96_16565 [Beijerinckiaceae bacterium]
MTDDDGWEPVFEPGTHVNDDTGITQTYFEDVPYKAVPLHEGVPNFIDEMRALDDGRLVGMIYWVGIPQR